MHKKHRSEYEEVKFTTSKKIMWASVILFILTVIVAIVFSYEGRDTSVFVYILPLTGGISGTTIAFYMNKSKIENIFKFKIAFLEYKLDLLNEHPTQTEVIEEEVSTIENALNNKVDSTMNEAVDEDITIQSY